MQKDVRKSSFVRPSGPAISHQRIGAVSYLNTRPLLEGMDDQPQLDVTRAVPSDLREMLAGNQVDAALLPAIDLQRAESDLTVLPAGCIGCAGSVLTVRIFSQIRPHKIETLWVDIDSHTSVALAQVIWHYQFKRRLRIIPFSPGGCDIAEDAQAVLMIGDKVVTQPPIGFDFQFDLGRLWFEMTGLPFVFAVWAAAEGSDHEELYRVLRTARREGQANLDEIARKYAPLHHWPHDIAQKYLGQCLNFDFTDAHREGMEEFFSMAAEIGVIPQLRKVQYYTPEEQ
jgi:chorismate dehydratase